MSKVKPREVNMTPSAAAKILEKNTKNRPLSQPSIRKYSNAMKAGRWMLNGEPIIIADDGTLIDGQHRLQAVVNSGMTVPMIIVTGVSKSAFRTVDIGKKRTGADAISTHDSKFEKNRMITAAAAKIVYNFESDVFVKNREKLENDLLIDFLEQNRGIPRSVEFALGLHTARKIVPASALAALHYLFSKKDIDMAERFFNKLNTGENLKKDDPINVLRNKLFILSQEVGVIRSREVIPFLIRTWEAIRNDEVIDKLIVAKDYIPKII